MDKLGWRRTRCGWQQGKHLGQGRQGCVDAVTLVKPVPHHPSLPTHQNCRIAFAIMPAA